MSIIDVLNIPELLRQHLLDPAHIPLRYALLDALLGAGDEQQWEKIQREWEPRSWLIAKDREPILGNEGFYQHLYGKYWFHMGYPHSDYRGHLFHVTELLHPGGTAKYSETSTFFDNIEKCVADLCEKWNKLDQEQKDWL